MHIISHPVFFSSTVWHEHNSGFDNILPPAKFCFSHDKSASSEQWLDYARQVSCDRREEPLTAMSDAGGTEQGWEVNIFDDDPIPLLRQELKEFDALIGGCWYRGLVPYHEQMLHIFLFRASNNTSAWYLVNHESCTSQTYLVGWVTGIHFIMIEYERLCLELNQFHILRLSMFLFIFSAHKLRLSTLVFSTLACYQCG